VARGAEVRAHGYAHGAVVTLGDAHRRGQAGRDAVGGDDDGCPEGALGSLLAGEPAPRAVDLAGGDADDTAVALVDDRAGHGVPLEQLRARAAGVERERGVEVHTAAGEAVTRVRGQFRPLELDPVPAADHAQAAVADPAVFLADRYTHRDELAHGPGRQAVAADLVAGKSGLLEQEDLEARSGEVVGGGRTGRTCADDDDVSVVRRAVLSCHIASSSLVYGGSPCAGESTNAPAECLVRLT